jgi:VanZ family protein
MLLRATRALFWATLVGIGVLALLPATSVPVLFLKGWDKAQHAVAFLVLGALARVVLPVRSRVIVVIMLAYGAAIEVAQGVTGSRHADWRDWVADAIGLVIGVGFVQLVGRWRARRDPPPGPAPAVRPGR